MQQHDDPDVYYATIEERLLAREGVDLRRSLDGAGLAFEGRIFAFLTRDEDLVVKLPSAVVTTAMEAGDGERHRLGNRVMRAWLRVPFDESDAERWERYVERAYEAARGISGS